MSRTFVIEEHCTYTVEVPDGFGMSLPQRIALDAEATLDVDDPDELDKANAEAFFLSRGAAAFPVEVDQREVYPMEAGGSAPSESRPPDSAMLNG